MIKNRGFKIRIFCFIVVVLIVTLMIVILIGKAKKEVSSKTLMELSETINISDKFPEEVICDKQIDNGNLSAKEIQIYKIGDDYSITMEIHNNTDVVYEASSLELILLDESDEIIISMVCKINDIDKFIRVSFDTTIDISKATNVIIQNLT